MVSGRGMSWIQAFLAAILAVYAFLYPAVGSPLEVLSAPNVLRAGTAENIFVEIQDCVRDDDVTVRISVMTFPTKEEELASSSVTLTRAENFQAFATVKTSNEYRKSSKEKQYVYLQARFPDRVLEKVVLVSFQWGYIFLQPDKPIYAPNDEVNFRTFGVTPDLEPIEDYKIAVNTEIVTPEGIVLSSDFLRLRSGLASSKYILPEVASYGLWKLEARFNHIPQPTFSAEFEVKEYVYQSFEVKLIPASSFFYVDSDALTVSIKATYLFGETLDGTAYVIFGIVNNRYKRGFPGSLQRVPIQRGHGVASLTREHISQTFPDIRQLVGSSIFVAVTVLTENGGEMFEAEQGDIKIVTSPYTILFKKTVNYFKPGMPFDVMVEVVHPDDTPAQNVAVVINPGAVEQVTAATGVAKFTINTQASAESVTITARTNDPQLPPQRQASASMTALSYQAKSNNYLLIVVDAAEVRLGENMKFKLLLSRPEAQQKDITYLIQSRGQLVKHGRSKMRGQSLVTQTIQITKEMLPSFRIVAYYHTNSDEVLSDLVRVNVKDSCMDSLKLEPVRPAASHEPGKIFGLQVTADPGSSVGLVAVDKSLYVQNDKHRLTQRKIWDVVEQFDTGCTPGGGKDGMNVFYDAGLLFKASNAVETPDRTDLKCPTSSRRKRATTVTKTRTRLVSQFEDREQRECCLEGMRNILVSYTCERPGESPASGSACTEAFMRCCKEVERKMDERKDETAPPARAKRAAQNTGEEDEDPYINRDLILTRSRFPANWLWMDVMRIGCPGRSPHCASTTNVRNFPLPDSVTTWHLTGISLSTQHGICISEPLEVLTRRDFFIDLRLPYSAIQGEQIEIKAILHNYSPGPLTVGVDLEEERDLCSAAYNRGRYRQEVQVGAQTTHSVPFIVIPMRSGEIPIRITAAVQNTLFNDAVRKTLQVSPAGILVKAVKTVKLDPVNEGVDGRQVVIVNSEILPSNVAPNTPMNTEIFLSATDLKIASKEVISGTSVDALIKESSGSGEENMITTSLSVTATMYLDKTDQWESVGFDKRNEAVQHLINAYRHELAFRKSDGSFSVSGNQQSSVWLTAFAVKVFAMGSYLMPLETSVVCAAIKFLILSVQRHDGSFVDAGQTSASAEVAGADADAFTTAFCLIAMQESRRMCHETVNSLPTSMAKAVNYLEQRLPRLTSTYAVAVTSYALANENKLNQEVLYRFAAADRSHWPVPAGHVYTLEATAYALLALVRAEAFEEARDVMTWLSKQQRLNGNYGSTQATVMVYQAAAEYLTGVQQLDFNLDVDLLLPQKLRPNKYRFNRENHHQTRTSKFNGINENVKVIATGTGAATLRMVSLYYVLREEPEGDCDKFNLTLQLIPEKISDDEKIFKLTIHVLYKSQRRAASMSILDVGLPTGYTFNKHDLDALSAGRIAGYEARAAPAKKASLIIYLDAVSNTRPEEITFTIRQQMKVGLLQPAAVSVYEYYDPKPCVKFYRPDERETALRLCRDNSCVCASENCSVQRKESVRNEDRLGTSCDKSRVNFVYKVRTETFANSLSTDIYTMRILDVVVEGGIDPGPRGKLRTFLSYKHCRDALDLSTSKTYLIMGSSRDIHRDDPNQSFQYVLGEETWIEYWPTPAECQTDTYQHTCQSLEDFVMHFIFFGCPVY